MAQTIAIERGDHIGIRVRDLDRALGFYRVLGFTLGHRAVADDVAIVRNEHGVELNLIFNANAGDPDSNILMDVPDKFAGYTHMALRVTSIPATIAALRANNITITQGPVSLAKAGKSRSSCVTPIATSSGYAAANRAQSKASPVTCRSRFGVSGGRHIRSALGPDPLPRDFAVFLGLTSSSWRRYENHPLVFEAHPAHLIAADPARV